jgi:hypothetical protein
MPPIMLLEKASLLDQENTNRNYPTINSVKEKEGTIGMA